MTARSRAIRLPAALLILGAALPGCSTATSFGPCAGGPTATAPFGGAGATGTVSLSVGNQSFNGPACLAIAGATGSTRPPGTLPEPRVGTGYVPVYYVSYGYTDPNGYNLVPTFVLATPQTLAYPQYVVAQYTAYFERGGSPTWVVLDDPVPSTGNPITISSTADSPSVDQGAAIYAIIGVSPGAVAFARRAS